MPGTEFELTELPPMPIVAALPNGHPLSERRSVWLRELRGERFVMFPTNVVSGFSANVARLFAHAGFTPNGVAYANSTDLLVKLVACRVGIAIVTRGSLSRDVPGVRLVAIRDSHPTIDAGLLRVGAGSNSSADELCQRLILAFQASRP